MDENFDECPIGGEVREMREMREMRDERDMRDEKDERGESVHGTESFCPFDLENGGKRGCGKREERKEGNWSIGLLQAP